MWDYPRPPATRTDEREVEVRFAGAVVAATTGSIQVLETSHPPGWYLPPDAVDFELLRPEPGSSMCEWKGAATYWSVVVGDRVADRAAWAYPDPTPAFARIAGYVSFYPQKVECYVDGRRVEAQEGPFYGGWITPEVVGPFKGAPGTWGW